MSDNDRFIIEERRRLISKYANQKNMTYQHAECEIIDKRYNIDQLREIVGESKYEEGPICGDRGDTI